MGFAPWDKFLRPDSKQDHQFEFCGYDDDDDDVGVMISNRGGGGECDKRGKMMSSAEICVFCGIWTWGDDCDVDMQSRTFY